MFCTMNTEVKNKLFISICENLAKVDNLPRIILFPIPKGEEYKHMCCEISQGHEIEWVGYEAIVNEFGKPERFDSFKKRHPNFYEDVQNIFKL